MLFRCPHCRTRRKDPLLMLEHMRSSGHRSCTCGGYHYAHRPGSRCCVVHPEGELHLASRRGEPLEVLREIAMELAIEAAFPDAEANEKPRRSRWHTVSSPAAECPF